MSLPILVPGSGTSTSSLPSADSSRNDRSLGFRMRGKICGPTCEQHVTGHRQFDCYQLAQLMRMLRSKKRSPSPRRAKGRAAAPCMLTDRPATVPKPRPNAIANIASTAYGSQHDGVVRIPKQPSQKLVRFRRVATSSAAPCLLPEIPGCLLERPGGIP